MILEWVQSKIEPFEVKLGVKTKAKKPPIKTQVAEYLLKCGIPQTPTQIGLALGKKYDHASSVVSPALKKLVKIGVVFKEKQGSKVFYTHKKHL